YGERGGVREAVADADHELGEGVGGFQAIRAGVCRRCRDRAAVGLDGLDAAYVRSRGFDGPGERSSEAPPHPVAGSRRSLEIQRALLERDRTKRLEPHPENVVRD